MSLPPIKGKESLFYIKKNNVWFPVACLTSSPISEAVDMLETTTRDNASWKTSVPTNQSYTIALQGLMVMDDSDSNNKVLSYRELRSYKRNKTLIDWKRTTLSGYYIDNGKAYITSISDSDEADGFITFSATLQGYGMPSEDNERVYVLGDDDRKEIYTHDDNITVINTENI